LRFEMLCEEKKKILWLGGVSGATNQRGWGGGVGWGGGGGGGGGGCISKKLEVLKAAELTTKYMVQHLL